MNAPLASLYDISLGIHQIAGLALILIAVAITVISTLSRSQGNELLEKGVTLSKFAGPFFGLVLLTGAYQLIDTDIKFFQAWVIGALLLGIGFMGTLHGTWRPRAQSIIDGEVEGEEALNKAKTTLVAVATSMIIMIIVATYLMESQTG